MELAQLFSGFAVGDHRRHHRRGRRIAEDAAAGAAVRRRAGGGRGHRSALCRDHLALAAGSDETSPRAYVEQAFRRYLECGILSYGFARAFCAECGHDLLIAFSCKARAVCPSCSTRRMVETAAHLTDHVLPPLPVRQWVLATVAPFARATSRQ